MEDPIAGMTTAMLKMIAALVLPAALLAASPLLADRADSDALARLSQAAAFRQFIDEMRPRALAAGISRKTVDAAFAALSPDPKVIELASNQPEFNTPVWEYIATRVNKRRIATGRAMARKFNRRLRAIEKRFGVDRRILLAIWGMETNYGAFKGDMNIIRSLATLAFTGERQRFGRTQLVAALKILDKGDVRPAEFKGSWAGAMGHTQFIPTTYNRFAVDWTGDGTRDIWNSVSDALASTANYLASSGWKSGRPWGWEVRLPKGFDTHLVGRDNARSLKAWSRLALRPYARRRFAAPATTTAWLILPAGRTGPAFLVTANFKAILAYNNSIAYALSVGHLADRIGGGRPFRGRWPVDAPRLSREQRIELQKRLAGLGYYDGELEGRFGRKTFAAILKYQKAVGLPGDGYADITLLEHLRKGR